MVLAFSLSTNAQDSTKVDNFQKTDEILAIYISNTPVLFNSSLYLNDEKIAKKVLKKFNTIIEQKKVV